eukprot:143294_1
MANRQQQKKRKKKKKCKPNKVRNNHKTIKPVNVRRKKSEKQQTVIHNQRRPQEEEEKANENGLIEWRVTGNLLHQFKNAKQKQRFDSPQFRTIDGTTWRIYIYPRGRYSPDHCGIGLGCVQLSDNKQRIGVNFSFNVVEVDWIDDRHGYTFKRDGHKLGDNAFAIEQLMNVDSLTIKCFVEETMDVSEDNTYFEWKITNYWLKKWKNAKYEQVFLSPVFNAMGQEWRMAIWPNGETIEGTADLYIVCDSVESDDEIELNVCHYIGIDAVNHCQIHFDGNIVNKDDDNFDCTSPFQLDDIQTESEITICVKIWEKGSIERNEGRLMANIYSAKMRKLHKMNTEALQSMETEINQLKKRLDAQNERNNCVKSGYDKEIETLRHANERLKSKSEKAIIDHMEAIKSLNSFTQSLQTQIARLQIENTRLKEEEKETHLELIRIKKDLLEHKRLDTVNYLEWTPSQVVDWIISIHNGEYAQYEQ